MEKSGCTASKLIETEGFWADSDESCLRNGLLTIALDVDSGVSLQDTCNDGCMYDTPFC